MEGNRRSCLHFSAKMLHYILHFCLLPPFWLLPMLTVLSVELASWALNLAALCKRCLYHKAEELQKTHSTLLASLGGHDTCEDEVSCVSALAVLFDSLTSSFENIKVHPIFGTKSPTEGVKNHCLSRLSRRPRWPQPQDPMGFSTQQLPTSKDHLDLISTILLLLLKLASLRY